MEYKKESLPTLCAYCRKGEGERKGETLYKLAFYMFNLIQKLSSHPCQMLALGVRFPFAHQFVNADVMHPDGETGNSQSASSSFQSGLVICFHALLGGRVVVCNEWIIAVNV